MFVCHTNQIGSTINSPIKFLVFVAGKCIKIFLSYFFSAECTIGIFLKIYLFIQGHPI